MISLRRLCLLNVKSPWKYYFCDGKRPLYSISSLGIDSFIVQRKKTLESIENIDRFKENLKLICENNKNGMVFLEDLKKMIGIADSDEDMKLLFNVLRKYCNQREVVVFQGYNFGPELMRLLHLKNRHQDAVKLVEDEDLFPHFQHMATTTLLLDLLFKNNEYKEVIRIFEMYQNKIQYRKHATSCVLLYIAACCKLNTAECFEKALQIHKLCKEARLRVPLRNSLLFAALAIKQKQPVCAIETFIGPTFNFLIENLKCMAFAQAKCFDHVFCAIRYALNRAKAEKFFLTNEAVCFIENEIKEEDSNGQYNLEFQKLKEELLVKNCIVNEPLDKYLFEEITYPIVSRTPSKARSHRL